MRHSLRLVLLASAVSAFALFQTGCATSAEHKTATPLATEDAAQQAQLKSFEAFLDKNPSLEKELRIHSADITSEEFLRQHPTWREFSSAHPDLPPALQNEKRFLLHRALVRLAGNYKLERHSLARLDEFLDAHPAILAELEADPTLIVNMNFQLKHPTLAEFLEKHPGLSSAFYQNQDKK